MTTAHHIYSFLLFSDTGSCSEVLTVPIIRRGTGLELAAILLHPLPKFWDDRLGPPWLALTSVALCKAAYLDFLRFCKSFLKGWLAPHVTGLFLPFEAISALSHWQHGTKTRTDSSSEVSTSRPLVHKSRGHVGQMLLFLKSSSSKASGYQSGKC